MADPLLDVATVKYAALRGDLTAYQDIQIAELPRVRHPAEEGAK